MCLHKKCNWCDKRKPDTFKFKGWNKYTGLTICTDCFEKKWYSLSYKYKNS